MKKILQTYLKKSDSFVGGTLTGFFCIFTIGIIPNLFENFNLIVKTELLRRGLNFIAYFFIFLIGLEILLAMNKGFNTNRILIYGFGASLFYSFIEALVADSITVFQLPFLLQAFPLLLILPYLYVKKQMSF